MINVRPCYDCPRHCGAIRPLTADGPVPGYCHSPLLPVVARAALHYWEEPCISGKNGSGTVFFTSCNLRCVFCQNAVISTDSGHGIPISVERLREIYRELIEKGANNINLVTPTPYTRAILESLQEPLPVPVVYNCGGYESPPKPSCACTTRSAPTSWVMTVSCSAASSSAT